MMIQTFNNGVYTYTLSSPSLVLSQVKINDVDISKYLTDATQIGWYDVSKNSGRDTTTADGKMILNVISQKYRIDLATRPMTANETIDFFAQIKIAPTMEVKFLSPFDGNWHTIQCYRGDRTVQGQTTQHVMENNVERIIKINAGISQALIEL